MAQQENKPVEAKGRSDYDTYQTSLTSRYCSAAMSQLFSPRKRHSTWRKLWLDLAESQQSLGIETITDEAISQMKSHLELSDEDFELAQVEEKRRRHVSPNLDSKYSNSLDPNSAC
jgi:adenylosuccinate lyase